MSDALDAVIFDLDGTLVDSVAGIGLAMNEALENLGHAPHPLGAYRGFVGSGARALVEQVLANKAPEALDEALEGFLCRYETNLLREARLYPGIESMLRTLQSHPVGLAVLSNKPHALTQRMVTALLGELPWRQVWGYRPERYARKPDPASLLALVTGERWRLARCVYVGDTDVDIDTGRRAGMRAIGVGWGFRGAEALRDHGAQSVVETPSELLEALGG